VPAILILVLSWFTMVSRVTIVVLVSYHFCSPSPPRGTDWPVALASGAISLLVFASSRPK
jgi:hypothetical protein